MFKKLVSMAVAGGALLSGATAQDVMVDQYGTEYAPDLVPSSMSRPAPAPAPGQIGGGAPAGAGKGSMLDGAAGAGGDVLVGRLDGIVLVPTPGDVVPAGIPGVRGIWHDLEDFPPKVGNALNAYIGSPVTLESLDQMVRDTIRAYRASDRPVVDVLVPEQDITGGVVQLVVVEAKLGVVRVQGADLDTESHLRNQVSTEKGEKLRASRMTNDLAWMNRSPYRRVDMVYAPGFEFGTTDIILRTNEIDPWTFYFGYENSGNELLGEDRWVAGATWREAWGIDHTLSYQLTADIDFDNIISHSLVYNIPLPWRHSFTFLGAYVDSEADAGGGLDIEGLSWQLSGRYAIPLPWTPKDNMTHEIELGYDFKSSNSDLEFGGANFFNETTHIHQFSLGYNLLCQDDKGVTRIDLTGYWSPGDIGSKNDDATFQTQRADAESNYVYATLGVERTQNLKNDMILRVRGQGQISNGNLLASEQMGIGGPSTVRGYPTSVTRGDEGVLFSAELYSPRYSVAEWQDWRYTTDELRFLVFADFATADAVENGPGGENIFAAGVGLRWTIDEWLRIRADIGFPIATDLNDDSNVDDYRVHLGATAEF